MIASVFRPDLGHKLGRWLRKAPLRSRMPLGRTELQRRTPLKPANLERRARVKPEQYGPSGYRDDMLVYYPCLACGASPHDQAHVRSRGASGSWYETVPLCRPCHVRQHASGWSALELRHGVTQEELYAAAWGIARAWIRQSLPEAARVPLQGILEFRDQGAWQRSARLQLASWPPVKRRLLSLGAELQHGSATRRMRTQPADPRLAALYAHLLTASCVPCGVWGTQANEVAWVPRDEHLVAVPMCRPCYSLQVWGWDTYEERTGWSAAEMAAVGLELAEGSGGTSPSSIQPAKVLGEQA